MAINIIQGVQKLIDFADYNATRSASSYFNNSTEAYNYMLENAYKMGSDGAVRGVIDGGKVNGKIVEFQPNLTGGTEAGIDVASVTESGGQVEVKSGAAALTATPLVEVVGGVLAGFGLGILAYESNKDFWIDISNQIFQNFPGYEPITYNNIETMSVMTLFNNGRCYISEDVVQAALNYLYNIGAFNENSEITYTIPTFGTTTQLDTLESTSSNVMNLIKGAFANCQPSGINPKVSEAFRLALSEVMQQYNNTLTHGNTVGISILASWSSSGSGGQLYYDADVRISFYEYNQSFPVNVNIPRYGSVTNTDGSKGFTLAFNERQVNPSVSRSGEGRCQITNNNVVQQYHQSLNVSSRTIYVNSFENATNSFSATTSLINASIVIIPNIEELPFLPNATIPQSTDIPQEFPDWYNDIMEIGQIDPVTKELTVPKFLPFSVPNTSPMTNPVTTPQPAAQTGNVPATNPKPVGDSVLPLMTPTNSPFSTPTDPTPTPTPTPSIPIIPAIGGQANKLFTVYNPSQANLDALGSTLWTENIITQIVQMFTNNPMDAIISLHILYATPTTGANKQIKLGYVPTGVSCPEVTNQYVNVNCGTVRVPELFGDARDYANTDISIYLPMIGFRQLKTEDAMASNVSVDYRVDVFTGTVLATVTINKGSVNQVFYTYEGNCAVNLPLTGADKSRQMATAIGAVGAMVTGSPLMALGSATAIAGGSARAQIQRSGNFTGNAGAMGCKKPYIIVSSDVPYDAVGYNAQYGYPANLTVMLGTCHGYVKIKEVHADTISNATEQEKRDIENQLKQGIIIH